MIKRYSVLVAVGVVGGLIAPAQGQFVLNGYMTGEVEKPQYRTAIPLNPAQLEKLAQATDKARKGLGAPPELMKDLRGADREKTKKAEEAVKAKQKDVAAAYEKDLAEVLTPDQLKRLRQITLRCQGPRAFQEQVVRDELKLSDEQRAKVELLFKESMQQMRTISHLLSDPTNRKEAAKMTRRHDEVLSEKLLAILDDEQKRTWEELLGPPLP